jgi:hypothetical protein
MRLWADQTVLGGIQFLERERSWWKITREVYSDFVEGRGLGYGHVTRNDREWCLNTVGKIAFCLKCWIL